VKKKSSSHTSERQYADLTASFTLAFYPPYLHTSDKYLMHTNQASVRAQVQGRSHVIKTEVRAMIAQDAR
jgi:hypothetical protein